MTRSDGLSPRAREYHATTDKKPQHSTLTRRQEELTVTLQLPGCMPSPYMPSSKHWFVFAMHAPSAPCARRGKQVTPRCTNTRACRRHPSCPLPSAGKYSQKAAGISCQTSNIAHTEHASQSSHVNATPATPVKRRRPTAAAVNYHGLQCAVMR